MAATRFGAGTADLRSINCFSPIQAFLDGFAIAETTNGPMGKVTLVGGTVTVSNTSVTANSRIFLTLVALGTVAVPSALGVTERTAGTSFVITASQATDTSDVAYLIVEPIGTGQGAVDGWELETLAGRGTVAIPVG